MRVAILSPYPTFPFQQQLGSHAVSWRTNATWTVTLANHLAKIPNTEVHVLTEASDVASSKTIQANGVHLHFLKAPDRFKALTLWYFDCRRLHKALAEIRPDIVHGQGIENQYGFAAVTANWPHLLTIHGIPRLSNAARRLSPLDRDRLVDLLAGIALKKARNLVVINPFVAEYYALENGRYQLFSIPNAMEERFFLAPPCPREAGLVLSVGSVDPRKGNDILLRALVLLKQRQVSVRAIIAGPLADRAHVAELEQLIREAHLDVRFTDFIPPDQVLPLLQQCTVLVLPSRHETAPMVVSEAMTVGTPVIASRVGGVPHMVTDGVTGLLVRPEDASELADKIQYLLENEPVRSQLAVAARQAAVELYHPDRVAQLTRAAYERVLEGTARPGVGLHA